MNNFSCLDGSMVENLVIPVADQNVTAQEFNEPMSNAGGFVDSVLGTKEQRKARKDARIARREQRFQTRMGAKTARNQAKLTQAEALKESAANDSTQSTLASLSTPESSRESLNKDTSSSKNMTKYILIGLGTLVILGGAFFLLRKKD